MIHLKCKQKLRVKLKGTQTRLGAFAHVPRISTHWPSFWSACGRNFWKIALSNSLAFVAREPWPGLSRCSIFISLASKHYFPPKCASQTADIDRAWVLCLIVADKQQELDIPSLRIEETANDGRGTAVTGGANSAAGKKNKDRGRHGSGTMSQIQGVKRPLYHTNSFTGEKLPKFGVETPHEEELERVSFFIYSTRAWHTFFTSKMLANFGYIWRNIDWKNNWLHKIVVTIFSNNIIVFLLFKIFKFDIPSIFNGGCTLNRCIWSDVMTSKYENLPLIK